MMIKWSDVAGTPVRIACAGDQSASEAVVFLHGNPGSANDWEALVEAVGATRRALAPDLPDFGETQAPADFEHDVLNYAAWLAGALAQWGVSRADLVLHDFGGPIGLVLAAAHPDLVASVTLIDTGLMPGYRWHLMARIWRTPVVGELLQAITNKRGFSWLIAAGEPRGLPQDFVARMYSHYDRRTRRAVLRLYRSSDDPGGAATQILIEALAPHNFPALVMWGAQDRYLDSAYAERQRAPFPAAQVHVLEGSGHWPFADAPQTVRELLLGFLAALS